MSELSGEAKERIEGKRFEQEAIDAYFERQTASLAGKTIERIRESDAYSKCSAIDFTDGSSIVVAAMPWKLVGRPQPPRAGS